MTDQNLLQDCPLHYAITISITQQGKQQKKDSSEEQATWWPGVFVEGSSCCSNDRCLLLAFEKEAPDKMKGL